MGLLLSVEEDTRRKCCDEKGEVGAIDRSGVGWLGLVWAGKEFL